MFPNFDPSKMDPKVLMELSQLFQQLPPDKLARLQSIMHNMMAGFDVRKDLEEFESSLPPGFREKMLALVASQGPAAFGGVPGFGHGATGGAGQAAGPAIEPELAAPGEGESAQPVDMNVREARLTVLRAVAAGQVSPEEAEKLLFSA